MCEATPAGLAMPVRPAPIRFDGLGRASAGGVATGRFAVTITGDGATRSIGIEAETGYVD